jgi:hypothetical protein
VSSGARGGIDRRGLLIAAAWLVAGAAAVRLVDGFLGASPAAAAVLGAVLVDLLAGRAGVRWTDPDSPRWTRHLRAGAPIGASIGMALVVAGDAAGVATIVLGAPGLGIVFAFLRLGALAARDELLLRWLPIALGRRAGVPDGALVVFVVAAAVAPVALTASAPAVGLTAATALLGARLALATRGAIAPAASSAALALVLGPLSRGGVVDVTWWQGDPGPSHAAGAVGWMAAAAVALAALVVPRLARRLLGTGADVARPPPASGAPRAATDAADPGATPAAAEHDAPDQARRRARGAEGPSISSNSASSTRTGPEGGATRAPEGPGEAPDQPEGTSNRTRPPDGATTPGKP